MKSLIQFICSITEQLKQSSKGDGINCYDIAAINNHKAKIERLCQDCGWFLSFSPAKSYLDADDVKQTSTPRYYLGKSKLTNDSEADLLEAFGD